jgi:hypothetical protein
MDGPDNSGWFNDAHVIRVIVYVFLRLIPDHQSRPELTQKETRLVNRILKNSENVARVFSLSQAQSLTSIHTS